jgi:hypothetical protein
MGGDALRARRATEPAGSRALLRVSIVALRAFALGERLPRDRSGQAEVR